eukprot:g14926.t1
MAKKKASKGAAKQEAKELKKKKQEEKASKAAKKKSGKDAREAGEDDIEAILAEILKNEAKQTTITVTVCDGPPSPRANFTVTSLPTGDMILFGGECFDGQDTKCFNELFRWNVEKNEWRQIESPNTPPPRCSHQAAFFRDHLYVLGGEFATTEQFYHYKDFWRLNVKTNAWEKLDMSGKAPSARSGHRMVVWRNQLVLFGGFYEAFRDTKWFNDLYVMSFQDLKWRRIEFPATAPIPSPRSGHQMAVYAAGEQIFLYGGYSKEKEPGQKKEGKTHNDMWVLNMKAAASGGNPTWDRIGKKGAPPSIRSGAAMTVHKNRALLFGGVLDHEGPQHAVKSIFYNDLFAFDMERRRWFHLALKKASKKKTKGKDKWGRHGGGGEGGGRAAAQDGGDEEQEGEEDYIDSEDEREEGEKAPHENAFVYIDESGKLVYINPDEEGEDAARLEEKKQEIIGGEKVPSQEEQSQHAGLEEKEGEQGDADDPKSPARGDILLASAVHTADVQVQLPPASSPQSPGSSGSLKVPEGGEGGVVDVEAEVEVEEAPPCPLPRINPCLTVRGNTLYVYGGLLEVGDREFTLDDCWSLELNTRVAWKRVQEGTMDEQMWKGEEDESEMGSEWGEEDDDDDSDAEDGNSELEGDATGPVSAGMSCLTLDGAEGNDDAHNLDAAKNRSSGKSKGTKGSKGKRGGVREEIRQLQEALGVDDPNRTPQAGEVMRDFFDRTKLFWTTEIVRRREASEQPVEPLTEKELRRDAFALAGERYAELEPSLARLNALETEQRELEAREAEKRREKKSSGPRGSRR